MAGRILVLDDEENYAEMLQDLLREHDYRVDMATRPERAIDQLEQIPYDLVISDYKMPVMDGSDFLKKARELYPNLPFILVSGLMNTPELVKVANMSVTMVMEKPLNTSAFLSHVARFSQPMTAAEKEAFARESENQGTALQEAHSYPEEPRFFSAGSAASKRFMQNAWKICNERSHLFILEPHGGDAELAVRDLSVWRGNQDKPVLTVDFEKLAADGPDQLHALVSSAESSHVVAVRLSSIAQIADAREYQARVTQSLESEGSVLLVYLLEGELSESEWLQRTDSAGCALPPLRERPTDVAQYARRFSRLVADRLDQPKVAEFSPEVAYSVLAFEWPGNYKQLQQVIADALDQSQGRAITPDVLQNALGPVAVPAAADRVASLMARAQSYHFESALLATGASATELARKLELGSRVQTIDDLKRMPLINPKLATL